MDTKLLLLAAGALVLGARNNSAIAPAPAPAPSPSSSGLLTYSGAYVRTTAQAALAAPQVLVSGTFSAPPLFGTPGDIPIISAPTGGGRVVRFMLRQHGQTGAAGVQATLRRFRFPLGGGVPTVADMSTILVNSSAECQETKGDGTGSALLLDTLLGQSGAVGTANYQAPDLLALNWDGGQIGGGVQAGIMWEVLIAPTST